ncbi:MAG TPA: DinB family protein [Terriglobia bacterium]|nr:DinB family protein [Terriglobia bacterium]
MMDLQSIQALYNYNRWANARVLEAVSKLSPEQFSRDLENSFRSVRDTLVHILSAEWIWLERWNGTSPRSMLSAAEFTDVDAIRKRWDKVENDRRELIRSLSEEKLAALLSYVNTRGQTFAYPLWQMLVHVANHSTYHRGQITTLLRQVGAKPVTTDFLVFYDSK